MERCELPRHSAPDAVCRVWNPHGKRPHQFDFLWQTNPKEWEMWMNHIIQREDGSWYGWGHVLDYIGVEWRNPEIYADDYQIKLEESR